MSATRTRLPGNPSYGGYEYQILVTIWAALDLILAKLLTDHIVIEPPSHEDIEAELNVGPEQSSVSFNLPGGTMDLIVQAKSRSTGSWSSSDIADILQGNSAASGGTRGPAPRVRPLDLLISDERKHYVLVTNAGLEAGLMPHNVETLLEWPDTTELPPNARGRIPSEVRQKLAPRLALCSQITTEVLNHRIGKLLSSQGHIPLANQAECLAALKEQVRLRLLGHSEGRWSKSDLTAVLVQYGGSILSTRTLDHYVPPSSYAAVVHAIESRHVALITGPSGTGKTLTADILEERMRRSDPPYLIVGEAQGPTVVREYISREGPVLFHLRDPWGSNRLTPGADCWSNELPKLLRFASADKKFLITSRSDILHSAGYELNKQLAQYMVPIEIEHYDAKTRIKIYDNLSQDLAGPVRITAQACRNKVIKFLKRPYEIDRFLVALSGTEGKVSGRKIDSLIADSQIEAISTVVAQQVSVNQDMLDSAAVIWGLLSARSAVAQAVVPRIRRQLARVDSGFRPGIESLVDFLVAGRNLRLDNGVLSFYHPKVEDGLRLAFMSRPADAERAIGLLCDALVALDAENDDWGVETAIGVKKAVANLDQIEPFLAQHTEAVLDEYLVAKTLDSSSRAFEFSLKELAQYGSREHLPSKLARILIDGAPQPKSGFSMHSWSSPNVSPDDIARLRAHPSTPMLIKRFICDVLPSSHTFYSSGVVDLLRRLHDCTAEHFIAAAKSCLNESPSMNVNRIVAGALADTDPPYEEVLTIFLAAKHQADMWWEGYKEEYRRAEEHEVDAQHADHICEEPGERFHTPEEGLDCVLQLRRDREGFEWIPAHPARNELVRNWIRVLEKSQQKIDSNELVSLLDTANEDWMRGRSWSIIAKHWNKSFNQQLCHDLVQRDIQGESLSESLIRAVASIHGDQWVSELITLTKTASIERKFEIIIDLSNTNPDETKNDRTACLGRARQFASCLDGVSKAVAMALIEALEGNSLDQVAVGLTHDSISFLTRILPSVSPRVAGPLLCIGAVAGVDPLPVAKTLLALDDAQHGCSAVLALHLVRSGSCLMELKYALNHPRWRVRREAMLRLTPGLPVDERGTLIAMSCDRSADVRLEFASLMNSEKWPEAADSLVAMLSDNRDFSQDPNYLDQLSWPVHKVARAAAHALKEFQYLSEHHITAMMELVSTGSLSDPFVTASILNALSDKEGNRLEYFLASYLQSTGLGGSATYRPVAQSAAWAIFDRVIDSKFTLSAEVVTLLRSAVNDSDGLISGPVIVAVGVLGDSELVRTVAFDIASQKNLARAELLLVATCFADISSTDLKGLLSQVRRPVERLVEIVKTNADDGEDIIAIAQADTDVTGWSRSLDPANDVDGVTSWLVSLQFKLPVLNSEYDPRKYRLPNRIPTMTMRSLSPMREDAEVCEEDGR